MKTQTLQHQFRLWTILLVAIPSLMIMVIYSIGQIKVAKQENLALISQRIEFQKRLIDYWMAERLEKIYELSQIEASRVLDEGRIARALYEKQSHDKNFDSLSYIDKDGYFKISTLSGGIHYPSVIGKPYFQAAQGGKEYISDVVIGRNSGQAIINFSYPIYDYAGNFQGLILGSVKTTTLEALLRDSWIGRTGEILLADREGTVLISPRKAQMLADMGILAETAQLKFKMSDDALLHIKLGETGTAAWRDYLGNEVLGAYLDMPERSWTIIGKIDEGEVFAPIYIQLGKMAGGTIIFVLLILPLATLITNKIKKPIEWLIQQSNLVAAEDYPIIVQDKSLGTIPHELETLCETFINMNDNINSTFALLKSNESKLESKVLEIQNINQQLEKEILERQRIFQELSNSEADNRALVEAIPDGLLRISDKGRVLSAKFDNKRMSSILTEKQINNRKLADVIPSHVTELYSPAIKQALATGELQQFEYHVVDNGVDRYLEVRIVPTGDYAVLAVVRDITEQKKATEGLVTMREAIVNAQRMASLGVMVGSIAHEINQPLNAIKVSASGMLYLMNKGVNLSNEDFQRELPRIVNEVERINDVVSKTLNIVRGGIPYKKTLLINVVLSNVLELLKDQELFKNIVINLQLTSQKAWIEGNQEQIEQIFLLLLANAGQALQDKDQQEKVISIDLQVADKVMITIADNGPGFEPASFGKIFEPFFTTGRTEHNMGLGLPIVQSIIYAHSGEIIAENNLGGGATFKVSFPLVKHICEKGGTE